MASFGKPAVISNIQRCSGEDLLIPKLLRFFRRNTIVSENRGATSLKSGLIPKLQRFVRLQGCFQLHCMLIMKWTALNGTKNIQNGSAKVKSMVMRRILFAFTLLISLALVCLSGSPQTKGALDTFFRENIGLSADQAAAIHAGQAVSKVLPSRNSGEVFLFGAVHIRTTPERYLEYSEDFERLRKVPNYLAIGLFSRPPKMSDLNGFGFDNDDVQALKNCKPGDCLVQMPATAIDELRQSIHWSSPQLNDEVNSYLQKTALQRITEYQRQGNKVLGIYNDKRDPTEVAKAFAFMLSYSKVLPERLPDFYNYLLSYPENPPANVQDVLYWERVKFGLKPTLRVLHKLVMKGKPNDPVAFAVAEKQLYASHYFETAIDLSFCVRDEGNPAQGFYLISLMGSEQAGLSGPKGAIVRKVAVGRSQSNLQDALVGIRQALESH
jgi:hypothetical protein